MASSHLALIPKRWEDLLVDDVWHFFKNVYLEETAAGLTAEESAKLMHAKSGFGIIGSKHAYFKQAYCRPFHRAVQAIFAHFPRPRIFDVCCGTGSQSIFFALCGAEVVGVDYDNAQLQTMRKRVAFYERECRTTLNIEIVNDNAREMDVARFGRVDVVYSHAGLGRLETAERIFARFGPHVSPSGLIILKDANPKSWWLKISRRRIPESPREEYLRVAASHGFEVLRATGTTAVPRAMWLMADITRLADSLLRPFHSAQVHMEYMFRKQKSEDSRATEEDVGAPGGSRQPTL